MRNRPADLIRAEIRRTSGQVIIHAGQPNARIHRHRTRPQLKIKIRGLVQRPRIRSGRGHFHKHVIVDKYAVLVLARCVAVFLQRLESSCFARLRFQLRLLLR